MFKRKESKKTFLVLALVIALGFFLRWATLSDNLFFAYEQGRDLLAVKKIVEGDLTLIGPRTSIEGIFHGPLYYYLMAPFYLVFSGNPLGVVLPFVLLGTAGIYLIYLIGRDFFCQKVGLLAAWFYAISYGAIIYSRWLSHPALASFFSLLFFYSLYQVIRKKENYLYLLILALAGAFQTEIVAALFLFPLLLISWWWLRPKIKSKKNILVSLLLLGFSFSSYLAFELRHQFLMVKSVVRFLTSPQELYRPTVLESLKKALEVYLAELEMMAAPGFRLMAIFLLIAIFFVLFLKIIKRNFFSADLAGEKILLLWLILTPPLGLFFWGGFHLKHYMVITCVAMVLAMSYLIDYLQKGKTIAKLSGYLLFFICSVISLSTWKSWLPANQGAFYSTTQPSSLLGLEKKVIDYTYLQSPGSNFSYKVFAIPYNMEHAWEYLYWEYGQHEYSFLPAHAETEPGTFFLILEPGGDELYRKNWIEKVVSGKKFVESKRLNGIIVETYQDEETKK